MVRPGGAVCHAALPGNGDAYEERRRLARVLHDEVQPLILAARMRLPHLQSSDAELRRREIEKLERLLTECLSRTRDLSRALSPPVLEIGTLAEVLEWLGDRFHEEYGLRVTVRIRGPLPELAHALRITLFAAVRELLLNVVKHSGSLEARVELSFSGGCLAVRVLDGGHEFDPGTVKAGLRRARGFGLSDVRGRLSDMHGRFEIVRTKQGGACFGMIVPIANSRRLPGFAASSRQGPPSRRAS